MLFCQPSCKHFAWEPPLLHRLAANYKNNVSFWTVFFVELFLWTGELLYWQACRKKFGRRLAKNWSMSHFSEKIMSFSKKICSENVFMATYYAVLTTSSENFRKKANKFSLDDRGWYCYCEKNFFTKIFEWTGRIYFSQHRRKHFDRKCSAQHRKLMKKCLILTERKSFFGIFWWTRRSQFRHKPVKNLIAKVQQFSRNVQKRWIMCTILSMKFFSQIVVLDTTMIALLTNPLKKVPTKRQKLSLPMRICYNTDILVNRKNSLELFLWTRRGQFWQPRWKEIDKRPKKFRSMTGKAENLLIFFFSLSNIFCRHVACSFDNAAEKKFRKARKVSPIVRKW